MGSKTEVPERETESREQISGVKEGALIEYRSGVGFRKDC
jgi:hypothetical protein